MRVLVTGGAGFIGSHVVDRLLEEGHGVVVLDNLFTGDLQNLKPHASKPSFRFVRGDVRDVRAVKEVVTGVDAVIHEAAITSVQFSLEKPSLTKEVNVGGTLNLLDACLRAGVKSFVFASSCAVYGAPSKLPISEKEELKPLSPYGESKVEAEELCRTFYEDHGLKTIRLRYFNVYGPRQVAGEYAGVMVKFLERLRRGQPPIIFGDGEQTRDFVYVGDVVEATLLALDKGGAGEVYNIGTGEATSINQLCNLFLRALGKLDLKPIYVKARPGEIRHSRADVTKARGELGFKPKVSLEEGIKKLIG